MSQNGVRKGKEGHGIRQEEGRASDGSLFVVQVDRGYTGRFRSGGYFLAMGRLSDTTSWDGIGEETRGQLHRDGSPGQGTYFDVRALFMPHGSAWVSGKRRDCGMNFLCLVDLLGKKNMARDFEDRRC